MKLGHPNVLQYKEFGQAPMCVDGTSTFDTYRFIVSEIAEKGDLFDFSLKADGLSENVAKNFFLQLVDAIEYIHG